MSDIKKCIYKVKYLNNLLGSDTEVCMQREGQTDKAMV